jgi:hypothetical protein
LLTHTLDFLFSLKNSQAPAFLPIYLTHLMYALYHLRIYFN